MKWGTADKGLGQGKTMRWLTHLGNIPRSLLTQKWHWFFSRSSHPGCGRWLLEFWLAYSYQFSIFSHAHRLIKCRVKDQKGMHTSLIHRMFPLRMVFIIFITPRSCSEQCFPGEKWGNISGFQLFLGDTLFLLGVHWLIFIHNAGGMTWCNVRALDLVSFVNSQNLGLKMELFPTHLNSCPPWQPCWWGGAEVRPSLFTLLVPTGEPQRVPQLLVNVSGPTCCLPDNADYSRAWLSLTVSGTSKYIISLKISSFQLTEQGNAKTTHVYVCVCVYCCLLEEWSSNPSRNWQGRETHMAPGCF